MVEIPDDPVQIIIDKAIVLGKRIALSLLNESEIMNFGNMSNQPNEIELQGINYEWLPKEAVIHRRVKQYRSPLLLACEVTTLYLLKTMGRSARATRPASNRMT